MEVLAFSKADHEHFAPRYELLLQQYIQQYVANTPDKRNKCQDIYQCTYFYTNSAINVTSGNNPGYTYYEQNQAPNFS